MTIKKSTPREFKKIGIKKKEIRELKEIQKLKKMQEMHEIQEYLNYQRDEQKRIMDIHLKLLTMQENGIDFTLTCNDDDFAKIPIHNLIDRIEIKK